MKRVGVRRIFYNCLGVLCIGVGFLGIITPVLPTTIFLLAASWLFVRSNPGLYRWLHGNRFTGPYLRAYTEKQGLSRRRKASVIVTLWVCLVISMWFVRDTVWVLGVLGCVGIGVTIHVATIRRAAGAGLGAEGDLRT